MKKTRQKDAKQQNAQNSTTPKPFQIRLISTFLLMAIILTSFTGFTFAPAVSDNQGEEGLFTQVNQADVSPNRPPGSGGDDATPVTPSKDDPVGQVLPVFDIAIKSGGKFSFQCTAPAGAKVYATINGMTYQLSHNRKVKSSTYVTFKRDYTMPSTTGTTDLGKVRYRVEYKGKAYTKDSEGKLFVVGAGSTLKVQVKNNAATVFNSAANSKKSGYRTVATRGAIDTVVDYGNNGNMYKLGTGGWIDAKGVTPLTTNYAVNNPVSSTSVSLGSRAETIALHGVAHPIYKANHTDDGLTITFYRTTGVGPINVNGSAIFSEALVNESDGNTTITLKTSSAGALWGFAVEYNGGTTSIVCKPKPRLSSGEQRLSGITIALDPGHGGKDQGTSGVSRAGGWVEKDVNLATARVVRDKLEADGATVIMVRNSDDKIELADRMNHAQQERVDLFVSLHCNSSSNSGTTGVEVYYHHPYSATLASCMMDEFTRTTGRKAHKIEQSHYIVTLNSLAPAILLEMGFMSNQGEYNELISQGGVEKSATGVYNGIVHALEQI